MSTMPRKADPNATRESYHHGDLRHALLASALSIVETEGIEALTLREVARRAGVSHAAPYNHFADKAALLSAVAEEGFRDLRAAMSAAAASDAGSPASALRHAGIAYVRFAADHPTHFRVMFAPEIAGGRASATLQAEARATFDHLLGNIRNAGARSPESALDGALTAWASVHGLAMLWIQGQLGWIEAGEDPVEGLAARVTQVLAGALSVATATP